MIHKHARAIGNALDGLSWALETQINYRVHIFITLLVFIFGWVLSISYTEWLIASILVIAGFAMETVNTAIEQLGDAIDTNFNINIKRAKDLAAGAMLVHSIGAAIIAAWIFIPKILILVLH